MIETDQNWKSLFKIGGIAALLAVFVFRRNLGAELMLFRNLIPGVPAGMPSLVEDWFALLYSHPLIGLTLFEVFDLVEYALVGVLFLAVCAALWRVQRSAMLLAAAAGWTGILAYFASTPAFAVLNLSGQYAAAASETQRAGYLNAGQALLAVYNPGALHQGTGIYICMLLVPLAGLIFSIAMLKSRVFNRATGVIGILANAFILGYFPCLAFAPSLLVLPFVLSAPLRVAWYFLAALRLLKLAKD